jgi:hypothetical protein
VSVVRSLSATFVNSLQRLSMSKTDTPSPFNWQGKPSIFVKGHDFNGVNQQRSEKATKLEKQDIFLIGSNVYLKVPEKQITVYGRAK